MAELGIALFAFGLFCILAAALLVLMDVFFGWVTAPPKGRN